MALTLREWRLAKELTQKDMAEALDVSIPTYKLMEDDNDRITIGGAKKASIKLGVDINDISFFA